MMGARKSRIAGSSPRMRGKPGLGRLRPGRAGLIPAHAGKTLRPTALSSSSGAHPRACGENPKPSRLPCLPHGSSPRMRGKPRNRIRRLVRTGLIPAHAGKTCLIALRLESDRAHPRACGENNLLQERMKTVQGSSPRMRGKPQTVNNITGDTGLIPAHAGKTPFGGFISSLTWAHPRACGENRLI